MQKLCINCKHYTAGVDESADKCHHPKSAITEDRSIRIVNVKVTYYECGSMLAGICSDHRLFEPITLAQLVQEITP